MRLGRVEPIAVLAVFAAAGILLGWPGGDRGATGSVRGKVVHVVDGDTIDVRIDGRGVERVRYIGVDTPETVKPGTPVQCFGPQASRANHRLVDGRRVRLRFDSELRDRYGRLLAYVFTGGRMVNEALVKRGFARTLTIAPNDSRAGRFAALAREASGSGRGLWSACGTPRDRR